jgi:hypothetical protein
MKAASCKLGRALRELNPLEPEKKAAFFIKFDTISFAQAI